MSKNLLNRYIWLIDVIRRHGTITRERLNELWMRTDFSEGQPLPRRTFYNYRMAIDELFKIDIRCNPSTFEYYIDENDNSGLETVTDWLLNTASMSDFLTDARDISDRVILENVPSARQFLSPLIGAMKDNAVIRFNYSPFTRTGTPKPVLLEPYFLKIFRQRWYMTGRNVKENKIKTYALDRMSNLTIGTDHFELPADFDPAEYFRHSFGIIFSQGDPKKVTIRATPRQAKYLRALPLHPSQSEMIGDTYSLFHYTLRLTPDFVQELLSQGPEITVLAPPELRAMMTSSLQQSLDNYKS